MNKMGLLYVFTTNPFFDNLKMNESNNNTFLAASVMMPNDGWTAEGEKIARRDLERSASMAILKGKTIKVSKTEAGTLFSLQLRVFNADEYDAIIEAERKNARLEVFAEVLRAVNGVEVEQYNDRDFDKSIGALKVADAIQELVNKELS
jgi:hypothetical protein